jgi:hypothetical protein
MSAAVHNELVRVFLLTVIRKVVEEGEGDAAVMVVIESAVLAALLTNEKVFGVDRRVSAERLEALTQAVHERLSGSGVPR